MGKLNFQFHAIDNEIIQVIKNALFQYNLFLISVKVFPEFSCKLISKDIFEEEIDTLKNSRMLLLCNYKPEVVQNEYNQFMKANADCLIFEIGGYKNDSLKESRISTVTKNVEVEKIWKNVIKEFKSSMLKGAWVINPMNEAKEYYKNHYYTAAAKRAFLEGIKIIPLVGWNQYVLEEKI